MGDTIELLLGVCVVAPISAYVLARLVFAYRDAEQRRWLATQRAPMSPVAAGGRAPRGGRASRSVVSPAAGGPAVAEVPPPDARASATVAETRR